MIGTYILHDELLLATPPPHPSEAPPAQTNPLAISIAPPAAGTKLSLAIITPKHSSQQRLIRSETPTSTTSTNSSRLGSNHENESWGSNPESFFRQNGRGGAEQQHVQVFGQSNPALTVVNGKESKDPLKRRKPKNNIIKSNSSFVSRVIPHEGITKRLQEHNPDGMFAFANINRALQWLDLSSPTKVECGHFFRIT
jgi:hypothetical protein